MQPKDLDASDRITWECGYCDGSAGRAPDSDYSVYLAGYDAGECDRPSLEELTADIPAEWQRADAWFS